MSVEEPLIIAEIGNNHEGDFDLATRLVRAAAECGVDGVKFQTFRTEHYVARSDERRFKQLKSFELTHAQFRRLAELARSLGLKFFSTPFDLASAEFLDEIVDAFKISSGDNTFYPLIETVAKKRKHVILSTGLSSFPEIEDTVRWIKGWMGAECWPNRLTVLHCVTSYPVKPEYANLNSIPFMAQKLNCAVGYSDHTEGVDACLAAAALGARLIEKHFTLDKNYSEFRDHKLSADPREMKEIVSRVRRIALMLGRWEKEPQADEKALAPLVRRSIVAIRDLPRGHSLGPADITWVRPGGGLAPGEEAKLLNRPLRHAVAAGDKIRPEDVE